MSPVRLLVGAVRSVCLKDWSTSVAHMPRRVPALGQIGSCHALWYVPKLLRSKLTSTSALHSCFPACNFWHLLSSSACARAWRDSHKHVFSLQTLAETAAKLVRVHYAKPASLGEPMLTIQEAIRAESYYDLSGA